MSNIPPYPNYGNPSGPSGGAGYPSAPPYPSGNNYNQGAPPYPAGQAPGYGMNYNNQTPPGSAGEPPCQRQDYNYDEAPRPGKGGNNMMKGLGDFAGRNKMAIGTTLLNYKMGGGIGKMLAAGQAADLANRYSKEHKHSGGGGNDYGGGAGYSGGGGGHGSGGGGGYGGQAKGLAAGAVNLGKDLFGKAKQEFSGSSSSNKNQPEPQPQYGGGHGGYNQQQPSYGGGGTAGHQGYPPQAQQQGPPGQYGGAYQSSSLQPGSVVSLTNEASHRAIQIVTAPTGQLVVDSSAGADSAPNAIWTVSRDPSNPAHVMLHNNYNYLAVYNGNIILHCSQPSAPAPIIAKWKVVEKGPQLVELHAAEGPPIPLAFNESGAPVSYAGHGTSQSVFRVRIIHSSSGY